MMEIETRTAEINFERRKMCTRAHLQMPTLNISIQYIRIILLFDTRVFLLLHKRATEDALKYNAVCVRFFAQIKKHVQRRPPGLSLQAEWRSRIRASRRKGVAIM